MAFNSFERDNSVPEPHLNSGMAGLQMAISTDRVSFGNSTPTARPSIRPKPSVPQKKTHVDELIRVKMELKETIVARDQAYGERDAMADDLLKMQEDIEERDAELKKLSREVWTWREKAEKMSNDKPAQGALTVQSRRLLAMTEEGSPRTREVNIQSEDNLPEARKKIRQLTAALAESNALLDKKTSVGSEYQRDQQASSAEDQQQFQMQLAQSEDYWRSQLIEHQKLRQAAESALHSMREIYEQKLKDVELETRSSIEQLQHQLRERDTAREEQSGCVKIPSHINEELEHLRQLVIDQETKINDQRQCAEQFRRMSERLTTQIKQANWEERIRW